VIGNYFTDQNRLVDRYSINTNEFKKNYNIAWAYDIQDQNTLDNINGRVFQMITEPLNVQNAELETTKGLEDVQIPCSLGLRKNSLTRVEDAAKKLGKIVDTITLGATQIEAQINARKGSLLLSSDFTTIPKIIMMSGDKLKKNQRTIFSAENLYDNYHFIKSFAEEQGRHSQYYTFKNVKVPFCWEDFLYLEEENSVKTEDDEPALIERLNWKVWENYATIDYRINKKYTNNLRNRRI
jgi:hypothetical protein